VARKQQGFCWMEAAKCASRSDNLCDTRKRSLTLLHFINVCTALLKAQRSRLWTALTAQDA